MLICSTLRRSAVRAQAAKKHKQLVHADGGECACRWLCLAVEDTAEHGLTDAEMCNLFTAFAMLRTGTQLVGAGFDLVAFAESGGKAVNGYHEAS